jgi:hypothetical protein
MLQYELHVAFHNLQLYALILCRLLLHFELQVVVFMMLLMQTYGSNNIISFQTSSFSVRIGLQLAACQSVHNAFDYLLQHAFGLSLFG